MEIDLPNNWKPRHYQMPLWLALEGGCKRVYEVAHRRWGKDDVCLHWTACAAMQAVGNYWHMLPIKEQARKAIWKAVNPHTGKKRIDEAFPLEIRRKTNDHEMFIEFVNGSTWQVLGSDSYDSHVGAAPLGIVFSEWALADPQSWAYIRPILLENGGWALFITTPRGRNHAASMFKMAQESPDWYCEKQTVDDTGIFDDETLKKELKEYQSLLGGAEGKAKFEQEYYCSFDAALPGAYFGSDMNDMEQQGRICGVPHTPGVPVFPCFDFGKGQSNATCITFVQVVGREPRVIDYYEDSTGDLPKHGQLLQEWGREKGYHYGTLIIPHDGKYDRYGTGVSYQAQLEGMGFDVVGLTKTPAKELDIIEARKLIKVVWIDKGEACGRLVDCLRSYHREWDTKLKRFSPTPKHDWASHGADSFMQAAVAYSQGLLEVDIMGYDEDDYEEEFADDTRNATTGY